MDGNGDTRVGLAIPAPGLAMGLGRRTAGAAGPAHRAADAPGQRGWCSHGAATLGAVAVELNANGGQAVDHRPCAGDCGSREADGDERQNQLVGQGEMARVDQRQHHQQPTQNAPRPELRTRRHGPRPKHDGERCQLDERVEQAHPFTAVAASAATHHPVDHRHEIEEAEHVPAGVARRAVDQDRAARRNAQRQNAEKAAGYRSDPQQYDGR